MSRDHRKLEAFQIADELVLNAYKLTAALPTEERYGLQSQLRRAAVSVATNIVEGSARSSEKEYCRFLNLSHASAREVAYLLGLCVRLEFLPSTRARDVINGYDHVAAMLLRIAERLGISDGAGA